MFRQQASAQQQQQQAGGGRGGAGGGAAGAAAGTSGACCNAAVELLTTILPPFCLLTKDQPQSFNRASPSHVVTPDHREAKGLAQEVVRAAQDSQVTQVCLYDRRATSWP